MRLSAELLGWLRHLHATASVINDCSAEEVIDSAYALALMAHVTPAWIEPYVEVLDQLIDRETSKPTDGEATDGEATDGETSAVVGELIGVRSLIDTSVDVRRGRRSTTIEPVGTWNIDDMRRRLAAVLEASSGSTWKSGEFSWRLGADGMAAASAIVAPADVSLARPVEACPQIVDVDTKNMGFDRAEWVGGNLHLGLAPNLEDPSVSTSFRVVGAEPRMWDIHGVENARMESRMSGLNLRVPMVKADVTLIRSSY